MKTIQYIVEQALRRKATEIVKEKIGRDPSDVEIHSTLVELMDDFPERLIALAYPKPTPKAKTSKAKVEAR